MPGRGNLLHVWRCAAALMSELLLSPLLWLPASRRSARLSGSMEHVGTSKLVYLATTGGRAEGFTDSSPGWGCVGFWFYWSTGESSWCPSHRGRRRGGVQMFWLDLCGALSHPTQTYSFSMWSVLMDLSQSEVGWGG